MAVPKDGERITGCVSPHLYLILCERGVVTPDWPTWERTKLLSILRINHQIVKQVSSILPSTQRLIRETE